MDNLLFALAAILALNVAFGVRIAISEFFSRRRDRQELGALESMWHHDPAGAERERRRRRLGRRTAAAAAAVLVLSGAAIAKPTREAVVSTVGVVVERFTDGSTIAAPAPQTDPSPSDPAPPESETSAPSSRGSHRGRNDVGERGDAAAATTGSASALPTPEGTSAPSPPVDPTAESPPELRLDVRAVSLSSTAIQVSWDPVPSATSYLVECSPDCPTGAAVVDPSPDGGSTTFDGLIPATSYGFAVTADTDAGPVRDDVSATTSPAPAAE